MPGGRGTTACQGAGQSVSCLLCGFCSLKALCTSLEGENEKDCTPNSIPRAERSWCVPNFADSYGSCPLRSFWVRLWGILICALFRALAGRAPPASACNCTPPPRGRRGSSCFCPLQECSQSVHLVECAPALPFLKEDGGLLRSHPFQGPNTQSSHPSQPWFLV